MKGKKILLGITGGIAAYKTAYLVRILKKKGAEVKCILTPASSDFISPVVLATLSGNPVDIEFWDKKTGKWANHVELALWADVFLICPLTANSLAKMAHGQCDNLLLATYLSMKGKTIVAPAMDLDMYAHPTTVTNLRLLEEHGVVIIPAASGELASGLEGEGRMAEPEVIASTLEDFFINQQDPILKGKTILVTAGPTHEAIDPVRFIGNHSSGKMGFALVEECLDRGANVVLIHGPISCDLQHSNLRTIAVASAREMLQAVQENWNLCEIGIFAAAVADYRPEHFETDKIKKTESTLEIKLIKNPDILRWAGEHKTNEQILVGFALETNNVEANALSKLQSKNLDFIVLNSPNDSNSAFGYDTNKITILDKYNNQVAHELKSKRNAAADIVNYIKKMIE
jgi:phosphopantothenoylcysteine decarboxylase / phosphopantothenate---cysteine ligase